MKYPTVEEFIKAQTEEDLWKIIEDYERNGHDEYEASIVTFWCFLKTMMETCEDTSTISSSFIFTKTKHELMMEYNLAIKNLKNFLGLRCITNENQS